MTSDWFTFAEMRGDPEIGPGVATLAGFCLEGMIRVGDHVDVAIAKGGYTEVDLTIAELGGYRAAGKRYPFAAELTVTGDDVEVITAGVKLIGENAPIADGDAKELVAVESPGRAANMFGFAEMRGDPRIGPGTATFAGKGREGVIRVGDRFKLLITEDGAVSDVDLGVTDIGFYGQYIQELEPAMGAELTVIGDDVDLIVAKVTLWGENRLPD